jgi:hypothetical protein
MAPKIFFPSSFLLLDPGFEIWDPGRGTGYRIEIPGSATTVGRIRIFPVYNILYKQPPANPLE